MPHDQAPLLHASQLALDLALMDERQARRRLLRWMGAGLTGACAPLALVGCGGGSDDATSASTTTGTTSGTSTDSSSGNSGSSGASSSTCSVIPSETAGPYPGDGTNTNSSGSTVNVLTQSGVVRADITSSFGSYSGTAAGVPLTVTLTLVNTASSCASLAGYAVYLWHCDRAGNYSLYSSAALSQNYLRGVQVSDANGQVSFTTIFPGCYSGWWPHIHFEIYPSLASATSGSNDVKTSQLALPSAVCSAVYNGAAGYTSSVSNFAAITLASDNIFGDDDAAYQLAAVSGSLGAGYTATLQVGISA